MVCLCQSSDVPLSNLDLPSKGLQNQVIQENTGNKRYCKNGVVVGNRCLGDNISVRLGETVS